MTPRRLTLGLLFACVAVVLAADTTPAWTVEVTTARNSGSAPLVAMWLEAEDGTFVATVKRYGRKAKYFKALSTWHKASKDEKKGALDAVTGPTLKWGKKSTFSLPIKTDSYDLSKGGYVLRVESKAKKKRGSKVAKIAIGKDFKGGDFAQDGHVTKVSLKRTN